LKLPRLILRREFCALPLRGGFVVVALIARLRRIEA
jgi:hypothetical protein